MTQILPRFTAAMTAIEDARKIGRILEETGIATPIATRGTAGGDDRRLRGIPCVARGVAGCSPGTNPLAQALRSIR